LKGIETYKTTSGIRVMKVHYSADPAKNPENREGAAWIRNQLNGYPGGMRGPKWRREMEIDFTIRQTTRVWPYFDEMRSKIAIPAFPVPEHWPLWAGYDYGYTNPFAIIVVAFENEDSAYVVDEIVATQKSVYDQAKLIKERPWFDKLQGIIADNQIFRRDQQDGPLMTSIAELFQEAGIYMTKTDKFPGMDAAFINLLSGTLWRGSEPRFKVFDHCLALLSEFRTLAWKQWASDKIAQNKPKYEDIINKHVDAFDAVKYVMLSKWRGEMPVALGTPKYSFEWEMQRLTDKAQAGKYIIK
jgi:hypothetical protein